MITRGNSRYKGLRPEKPGILTHREHLGFYSEYEEGHAEGVT